MRSFLDALLMKRVAEIEISCQVFVVAFRNEREFRARKMKGLAISHSVQQLTEHGKKNRQGHNPNHYPEKKIFRFRHLLIAASLVHFALLVHDTQSCCRLIAKGKYVVFSMFWRRPAERLCVTLSAHRGRGDTLARVDPCIPRLPRLPAAWPPGAAG